MEYVELQGIFLVRILLACLCGAVIGIERQHRTKSVGVRTHLMIAIASALMMLVSKYGFLDIIGVQDGVSVDVSRVAAGIITGIGIFGGVIYMGKQGAATGVTTTAGVWVTVGLGMACGAGMYPLAVGTACIVLICQYVLHSNLWIVRQPVRLQLVIRFKKGASEDHRVFDALKQRHIELRQLRWERKSGGYLELKCLATVPNRMDREEAMRFLLGMQEIAMIEIL